MVDPARYERIGTALRALAADLAAERRENSALRRENERLKEQLEAANQQIAELRRSPTAPEVTAPSAG